LDREKKRKGVWKVGAEKRKRGKKRKFIYLSHRWVGGEKEEKNQKKKKKKN